MDAETILTLVGLLMALAIAVGGLRGQLRWSRWMKSREAERRRERDGDGPWG